MAGRATIAADPLPPRHTQNNFLSLLIKLLAFVIFTPILTSIFVAVVALSDRFIVVPVLHLVLIDYEGSSFHKSFLEFLEVFPLVMFIVHGFLLIKMVGFIEDQAKTIFFENPRVDHEI